MAMSVEFQSFIDEIIDKNDIVEVVSMYTKLKRSGRTYRGLCPIHNDRKNPALSVDPQNRLFKCFGCGAGGTVIQFIMAKENLDFMEAVKLLADRAGLTMPERQSPQQARAATVKQDRKKRMLALHKEAAKFFYQCLCDKENSVALNYLGQRGISGETIKAFGLGYSPNKNVIGDFLKDKGYAFSEIEEAGLIKKGSRGYYDSYRGRVIFPIFDIRGNVIAFGGRIITSDTNAPKYLNSNGSIIYNKSENLFAFNRAKDVKSGEFLLMEGYMDVISLHQAGFKNAVASLGTAFTQQQAQLIKKYGSRVVLCYDSDEAGQKATDKAGRILMAEGLTVKVLTVVGAKDPDEYIKAKGPEMFRGLIDKAENFIEYKIRKTAEKYDLDDIDQKIEFIMAASQILAEIKDPTKLEVYVNDIAKKVDIKPEKFMAQIENIRHVGDDRQSFSVMRDEMRRIEMRRGGRQRTPKERRLYEAEKLFLNLICDKRIYDSVKDGIVPEDMTEDLHKRICEKIYEIHERGEEFEATRFVSDFPQEEIGAVTEILTDDRNVESRAEAIKMPVEIIKEGIQERKIIGLDKNDDEGLLNYFRELRAKKRQGGL